MAAWRAEPARTRAPACDTRHGCFRRRGITDGCTLQRPWRRDPVDRRTRAARAARRAGGARGMPCGQYVAPWFAPARCVARCAAGGRWCRRRRAPGRGHSRPHDLQPHGRAAERRPVPAVACAARSTLSQGARGHAARAGGRFQPALHVEGLGPVAQAGPADGAPGRRAGRARHGGRLDRAAICRRGEGRHGLGPWRVGRQGQPDRPDGSRRIAGGERLPAPPHHPLCLRCRRGDRRRARRRADRRAAEITRRATGLRDRRGPADHRGRGAGAGQAGRADRRHREGLPVGGAEAVRDARPFVDAAGRRARARSP